MASTTFCDWCGERMELGDGETHPFGIFASGRGENDEFWMNMTLAFHVHVGAMTCPANEYDPESCFGQLMAVLEERKKWAHDPDQKDAEWRLVDRQGRLVGPQLGRVAKHALEQEERSNRHREEEERRIAERAAWRNFPFEKREEVVLNLLAEEPSTISELCDRMEEALPEMGTFYEGTVRPLVAKMFKGGKVNREDETFHGTRTRYRYCVAEGAA